MKYLLFLFLPLVSLQAQSSNNDELIRSLLSEVRQLRLALEKSAVVSPRVQIVLHRMQLQQEVATRVSRDLDQVREQLRSVESHVSAVEAQVRTEEARAAEEKDEVRKKAMDQTIRGLKAEVERTNGRLNGEVRIREAELASRYRAEQAKLDDLAEKLNVLEQMLEAPPIQQP